MDLKDILWFFLFFCTVYLLTAGDVSATMEYATRYRMTCSSCHSSQIPALNEFGAGFRKRGYRLAGEKGEPGISLEKPNDSGNILSVQGQRDDGAKVSGRGSQENGIPKPVSREGEVDSHVETADREFPPRGGEAPLPTVVYRFRAPDGTLLFTDNPLRKAMVSKSASRREKSQNVASSRKTISGRVVGRARSSEKPTRKPRKIYGSYSECMEALLVDAPRSISADEMMELYIGAEERCSSYEKKD